MQKIITIGILLFAGAIFMVTPAMAQLDIEPVQLPDGTFVVPDSNADTTTDSGNTTEQTSENNDFISGIAVGAAVGFVGGSVIAWFLKPSDF